MNPAVTQSLLLAKHLRNRNPGSPAWVHELDEHFVGAAYERNADDPFLTGPDNLAYYMFRAARSHDVEFIPFEEAMNTALQWATGAVVYPGGGVSEWVYGPGDLVSLSLCRTSAFQWQGDWGLDPNLADYSSGGTVNVGRPNPEFLAPLAARCLEFILRRVYASEPALKDRIPSLCVLRPEARKRPEQASELMINAYASDFSSPERAEGFVVLARRFLPSHLSRRFISFDSPFIPEDRFTTLTELIAEGGLEPVPEVEIPTA